jgi:hypothetical protein
MSVTIHRGAVVRLFAAIAYDARNAPAQRFAVASPLNVGVRPAKRLQPWGDRFNVGEEWKKCLSGVRMARLANKARQRKKGPLVRFGGRIR